MEERRFDELTRRLGAATSRRQVLKGVLGGVLAAAVGRAAVPQPADAAGSCGNIEQCRREVEADFRSCLFGVRALHDQVKFCLKRALSQAKQCREAGCSEGLLCCNEQCVDIQTDQGNCGACFNACTDRHVCESGTCVCTDVFTICQGPFNSACCLPNESCYGGAFGIVSCEKQCDPCEIYDPSDPSQPCKPVECPPCQSCDSASGQCVTANDGTACGSNEVCCGGQCQSGAACDCAGQADGMSCGQNMVCCGGTCVSGTDCSCAGLPDNLPCGDGQICCNQQCVTATDCACYGQPDGTSCADGWVCCNGACDHTPGEACCADRGLECGTQCCDAGSSCATFGDNVQTCCPIDPSTGEPVAVKPDGTCCGAGDIVAECTYANSDGSQSSYFTCCALSPGENECNCCPNCCTDITTCSVHLY